jgi:HSP20 family protein
MPKTKSPRASQALKKHTTHKGVLEHILAQIGTEDYYTIPAKALGIKQEDVSNREGQLSVDVVETNEELVIMAAIAGVRPHDIELALSSDMITIRGERKRPLEVSDADVYVQECFWGRFSRTIVLPKAVVVSGARAMFNNGVLIVTLPKENLGKNIPIIVVEDD